MSSPSSSSFSSDSPIIEKSSVIITSSASAKVADNCLICGKLTDALHFQITSCRACSAFFRRALQSKKEYACQRGTKKCDLTKKVPGKPLCRYCRFRKCSAVGMQLDGNKNAPDHNIISSSNLPDPISSNQTPKNLINIDCKFVDGNIIVNWESTEQILRTLLNSPQTFIPKLQSSAQLTELQRFQIGLSRLINFGKPKGDLQIINESFETKAYMIEWFQTYLTILTQLLTGLKFFMKLSIENRFSIFKKFWLEFQTLERICASSNVFGYDINDSRTVINDKHVNDCLKDCFTLSTLSTEEKEKYKQFHLPWQQNYVKHVMIPMKELKITETELAYLGILLLWEVRGIEGIESEAHSYAKEVIDRSSSEMHHYYTYEMRITNYASRLMKISQIVSAIHFQSEERKKIATIAQVFNLFTYDLNDCPIIEH